MIFTLHDFSIFAVVVFVCILYSHPKMGLLLVTSLRKSSSKENVCGLSESISKEKVCGLPKSSSMENVCGLSESSSKEKVCRLSKSSSKENVCGLSKSSRRENVCGLGSMVLSLGMEGKGSPTVQSLFGSVVQHAPGTGVKSCFR